MAAEDFSMGNAKTVATISLTDMNEYYSLKAQKEKFSLEFNRYKQDCRKKALGMAERCAQQEWAQWDQSKVGNEPTLTALADKYYNWLISIPIE